jgi:hypothetical protein
LRRRAGSVGACRPRAQSWPAVGLGRHVSSLHRVHSSGKTRSAATCSRAPCCARVTHAER